MCCIIRAGLCNLDYSGVFDIVRSGRSPLAMLNSVTRFAQVEMKRVRLVYLTVSRYVVRESTVTHAKSYCLYRLRCIGRSPAIGTIFRVGPWRAGLKSDCYAWNGFLIFAETI